MAVVSLFETENFKVVAHPKPFVDRNEGGHIKVVCKKNIPDRLALTPKEAVEFAWLTSLAGKAFKNTMVRQGVAIIKLNYQDMGNWYYKTGEAELLHIHIFGRVLHAKHQPFPESVYLPDRGSGFYDKFKPLTEEDQKILAAEIKRLSGTEYYALKNWGID